MKHVAERCLAALLAGLCLLLFAPGTGLAQSSIVIGHPACLSGKYAKAGEQAVGGIKACVQWVNQEYGGISIDGEKHKLEYKVYDSESKKESVTSLIGRLITVDKVDVVFSAYSSGLTLRGAPITESHNMLYMDHGGANNKIFEQGFDYVVQTIGPATSYHKGTLDMIKQIAPEDKRVALAYEDSEFARMVMEGAENYAEELGFNVVFKRTYPSGVNDLTPLLNAMKAADPDFVLGGGHYEDGQLFCSQMADMDFNVKALSLIASATLPAFYEALGTNAEGVMGPSHWEMGVTFSEESAKEKGLPWIGPSQEEFISLFKENTDKNMKPDYHAAEAGAQVLAYALGVEKAGSTDSDKVRKALGDLEFMSFYGGWDVNENGMQVGHTMVNIQWQDSKRALVWPESAQTSKPVYPMPTFQEKDQGAVAVPE
ncbi:MAG: amino acid ABC transporter substrate-binding protein [Desulfohalobiaceae bacterium]|nr:amino acid ABC transporter substrate-binding protein [Desulfohalobiaceae bacterium]MCF8085510.1 amino acid ABC transporter substrate-binding protein [Desulfohalobiaceae bacterium]